MDSLGEFIGESPAVVALRTNVRRLIDRQSQARRHAPILILGETGTGKGLLARLLHRAGPRCGGPFIDVNCPAIPTSLIEAELFGHERGAFTDARAARPGLFQAAHRGVIFLDEIGLLGDGSQAKLLKAIEDRAVRRLGGIRSEPVDTWIIAATSENLPSRIREGNFREDLYHRLAVVTLVLPPLRERGEDILLLAEQYLARACADYGLPSKALSADARKLLLRYPWPGNVRELANAMERLALLGEGPVVGPECLGLPDSTQPGALEPTVDRSIDATRRAHLQAVLTQCNWNISRAAAQLVITRNTLKARIRRYGLRPDAGSGRAPTRPAADAVAPRVVPSRLAPMGRAAVWWESRRVVFLRVDVSLSRAEALRRGSGRAVEAVVEKVQSFGGRTEEMSPTAVIAVFGLEPLEDAPRRAAHAAIAIQRKVRGDEESGGTVVKAALHFGEVVVARLGDRSTIDIDSKREAWAVLEALSNQAIFGSTVVSASAAVFLRRHFELLATEDLGERVGGAAYRLIRRAPVEFVSAVGAPSFVGRHDEMDGLHRALAAAVSGHGQVVGLVGPPGIGKSRLLHEFCRRLAEPEYVVLATTCPSHGAASPYLAVIDLVCRVFGIKDGDDPHTMRDRVTGSLTGLSESLSTDTPAAILALLGCLPAENPFQALTPTEKRRRTRQVVQQVLLAQSRRRPLVVVVDDLQWIDLESQSLLDSLVGHLSTARLLLLVSHRPEHEHSWTRKDHYSQLRLEPLPPASMQALLKESLGPDERLAPLRELIVRRTEGNPFFLEETVRTLTEARVLVGEWGAYEMAEMVDAIQVPPTVEAVLATRIHRLAREHKHVLQVAAVIGRNVPLALLAAVVKLTEPELLAAVTQLERAEFLVEASTGSPWPKAFRHALTEEVAYDTLLPEQRRLLHASVVRALETLHGDRFEEHVEEAAYHAYRAELWEQARASARAAGTRAAGRSAHREAARWFKQALAALDRLPPTPENVAEAIDLRFELRNTWWALGHLSRGLEYLREAMPLAETLGDERRLARLYAHTASNLLVLGDYGNAREMGQRALALATSLHDDNLQIDVNQFLGVLHNSLGEYRRAVVFLEANITALGDGRQRGRFADFYAVHSRTWLVWALSELGEFERAGVLAAEALRIASASNQAHAVVAAHWGQGYLYLAKGEPLPAVPVLERAHSVCQAAEIVLWARPSMAVLGRAYALTGRCSEGLALLERAVETDENNVAIPQWENYLAEAYLIAGRPEAAMSQARHARSLAAQREEYGFAAYAHLLLGRVTEHLGHLAESREHYGQALRLALEREMRPLAARCELGLARLCRAIGEAAEASAHLATARMLSGGMESPLLDDPEPGALEGPSRPG